MKMMAEPWRDDVCSSPGGISMILAVCYPDNLVVVPLFYYDVS